MAKKTEYVTIAEVRKLLSDESQSKKRKEMNELKAKCDARPVLDPTAEKPAEIPIEDMALIPIQKNAMQHAVATSKIDEENVKKLIGELSEIPCCKDNEEVVCKIVDIMPKYPEDVRVIFARERIKPNAEETTKILDTVNNYL